MFRDIELLKENCEQRNLMVDVHQLASDYQLWQKNKKEYRRLRDLHHTQERLRERLQSNDLSMSDMVEAVKKRKKKIKPTAVTNATEAAKASNSDR